MSQTGKQNFSSRYLNATFPPLDYWDCFQMASIASLTIRSYSGDEEAGMEAVVVLVVEVFA